jgi:hypothetical protein
MGEGEGKGGIRGEGLERGVTGEREFVSRDLF